MGIVDEACSIRDKLLDTNNFKTNPIDFTLPVIPPFKGSSEIKLIIIGQDPTVKNVNSRKNITHTLNLDRNNSLKTYIESICDGLGITIENVYATNLFKFFYTIPPANTMEVLMAHLEPNLSLLQKELKEFDDCQIITLGEPVIQLLINVRAKVRHFWDYNEVTKVSGRNFKIALSEANTLRRNFYPFPHQPSIRKQFYRETIKNYLHFMRTN